MQTFLRTLFVVLGTTGAVFADFTRLVEDYQVLQRDEDDTATCCVVVPQELPKGARFQVTVTDNAGTQIARHANVTPEPVGDTARAVVLRKLPVGGPYMVAVAASTEDQDQPARTLVFRQILVGDIWLMAGQSNMYGSVRLEEKLPALPYLNMLNFELIREEPHWSAGIPPLHRYPAELGASNMLKKQYPQATAAEIAEMLENKVPAGGIGPGYFFAKTLYRQSGVPIGLLPFALGAALADWDPAKPNQGRYGFVQRQLKKAGGRAKGVLWYQGEQDAIFGHDTKTLTRPSRIYPVSTYAAEYKKLVEALRRDCHNPNMPVILAQVHGHYHPPFYQAAGYAEEHVEQKALSGNLLRGRGWEKLREIQRLLPETIPHVHTVPTVDLDVADGLHLDYQSYTKLGPRMASVAFPYVDPEATPRTEIRLKSANWSGGGQIRVEFEGVVGKLWAPGKPTGFTLRNQKTGLDESWIFKIEFDAARPNVVLLRFSGAFPRNQMQLCYATGPTPYANIRDQGGMPLPALGPIQIAE